MLDTSALIGIEQRDLVIPPLTSAYVSTMTIGELAIGAAVVDDPDEHAIRRHTLLTVRRRFGVIDFSAAVAERFGDAVGRLRADGRRPRTADSIIAATAMEAGLPLVTQDAGFLAFEAHGLDVILV